MEKQKAKVISSEKLTETFEVYAYTGNSKKGTLKESGSDSVICFKEDEKLLPQIIKVLTLKDIEDLNRQRKTDTLNGLRIVPDTPEKAALKDAKNLQKKNPDKFADLLEFGKQAEQVKAGTLDKIDPELRARVVGA